MTHDNPGSMKWMPVYSNLYAFHQYAFPNFFKWTPLN